ncbi:MAG: hypothetical protein F6K24_05130 [Okeania sp. SIO2D1]|nr:hypothetical protein [Okeania sp. SIO2D1]
MPITDIVEALAKVKELPSIDSAKLEGKDSYVNSLLELNKRTVGDTTFYRIYATAANLLELDAELWIIKRHDRTELNTPEKIIEALLRMQAQEDGANGLISSGGVTNEPTMSYVPKILG